MIEVSGRPVDSEQAFAAVEALSRRVNDVWPVASMEQAQRAARSRDAALMLTLERMAEQGEALDERMLGQSRRTGSEAMARVKATEASVWREAYRLVDQGKDFAPLLCQVTAAAIWCGCANRSGGL